LNVGVDSGSRGVGDASGVGVALGLGLGDAATEGVGDGDGCWAVTLTGKTTNSESKNNRAAHAEVVIRRSVLFLGFDKAV
jgi:hypothetical protein